MKKRLFISMGVAAALVATMALPAMAATEQSVGASVEVGQVVSITLSDAGTTGINFVGGTPTITKQGDEDQSDGTPAIGVVVESETNVNVDIGIKGAATGDLALTNWKYSDTFAGTPTSIPASYGAVYTNQGVGTYDFYHWVDVPAGTPAGSQGCTVYYKAVENGTGF